MKKRYYVLIIILGLLFYLVYTGGCEFSTASISDVKVCTSMNGNICSNDNDVISGNPAAIYVSCKLKYAPEATDVKFTWYYYGQTKFQIAEVSMNSGSKGSNLDLHSNLSRPNNGWPSGDYEVVIQIMVEGKDPIVKKFTIQ